MRHWITSFHQVEVLQWGETADRASLESGPLRRHLAAMQSDDEISMVQAPWRNVAMVCGKCSRKLKGGFGKKRKQDLAQVLKGALKEAGRRRELRVVEVGCLGLCPKRAISVVTSAQPAYFMAVPEGTDPALVLARLSPAAAATP